MGLAKSCTRPYKQPCFLEQSLAEALETRVRLVHLGLEGGNGLLVPAALLARQHSGKLGLHRACERPPRQNEAGQEELHLHQNKGRFGGVYDIRGGTLLGSLSRRGSYKIWRCIFGAPDSFLPQKTGKKHPALPPLSGPRAGALEKPPCQIPGFWLPPRGVFFFFFSLLWALSFGKCTRQQQRTWHKASSAAACRPLLLAQNLAKATHSFEERKKGTAAHGEGSPDKSRGAEGSLRRSSCGRRKRFLSIPHMTRNSLSSKRGAQSRRCSYYADCSSGCCACKISIGFSINKPSETVPAAAAARRHGPSCRPVPPLRSADETT